MTNFAFAEPYWFLLFLLFIPMILSYRKPKARLLFSKPQSLKSAASSPKAWLMHSGLCFRLMGLSCLIFALARPQTGQEQSKQRTEGLDMMLVIDTSGSMRGMDFIINGKRKDRLTVAKEVLKKFIEARSDDRLGLTIFGSNAFAYVPLTLDHDVLTRYLDEVSIGMAGESTAIGDAIGIATNRLKDLEAKSKVMILLTDGSNQAGKVEPLDAAKAAKAMGVKIYSIGVGSKGLVPVPTQFGYQNVRIDLDEELLGEIANLTGGQYYRATDTETLAKIYQTIDELEKTEREIEVFRLYEESYSFFVWPALFFILFELGFGLSRWRRIP
ncbi:MAG: VWA domain-containing protein [Oligoflexales bacterium]|nr:VWA domain-containing protein [Oligoflexales bacterium]